MDRSNARLLLRLAFCALIPVLLLATSCGKNNTSAPPFVLVSIEVTPGTPGIIKGATQQFTATGTYSNKATKDLTDSVHWSSSDSAVAIVDASGLTAAVSFGTTTITANTAGISGSAELTVVPVLVSIAVTPVSAAIDRGSTRQFTATGNYSDNTTRDLTSSATWTTSDGAIATIDTAGLASAVESGNVTVQAEADGISGSTDLTVLPPAGTTAPSTLEAYNVTEQFATLRGFLTNPGGYTTAVWFDWGTTSSYGNSTAQHFYASVGNLIVSADLSGLQANTTYHYRLVTQNADGRYYGDDMTFTTLSGLATKTVIASGLTYPQNFAVSGNAIYWTEGVDATGGANTGSVKMTLVTGGTVTTLASGLDNPFGIAVDANNVYWTEQNGGSVRMMDLITKVTTTLVENLNTPQYIQVDSTNVYFTELGTWNNSAGIRNSDGTVKKVDILSKATTTLADNLDEPQTIAIDADNVYWTEVANYIGAAGSVKMVPISGGSVTTMVADLSGSQYIAADGVSVYYWSAWGTLDRVAITDFTKTEIASDMNGTPPLALDASYLYWTENAYDGTLKKVGIDGGPVSVLASGLVNASVVAVDDSRIYWMETSTFDSGTNHWNSDGRIMSILK